VLKRPIFEGKLHFAVYRDVQNYSSLTVQTIARALSEMDETDYKATILIDGLPRSLERAVGLQLRRAGVRAKKVRGLKDEKDALIRLADAVCGLVRGATEGQAAMRALFERGIQTRILKDLSEK
jgi:adenylate kinase family enzyme